MRSRAEAGALALLALAGCVGEQPAPEIAPAYAAAPPAGRAPPVALPPEAGDAQGPRATAGPGPAGGYDAVGYASRFGDELEGQPTASGAPFVSSAVVAAHRILPLGSYAEVTALDTGRTILVRIADRGPGRADREIDLSTGAVQQLGATGALVPVRVRSVAAAPEDAAALAAGRAAAARLDAPEAVLRALRRRLPAGMPAVTRAAPTAAAAIGAAAFVVQVAAFSRGERARALAQRIGGEAQEGGGLWRVRLGPFADMASAQRARDDAVRRGYADAAIMIAP
jgi:rare lipoprotein A